MYDPNMPNDQQPGFDPNAQQAQPEYQQPPYEQQAYQQPGYQQPPYHDPNKPEGLAIASMVLGICGLVVPYGGLICAILALVFASKVASHYPNGNLGPNASYVKAGRILGWIAVGISILIWVITIASCTCVACLGAYGAYGSYGYYY